MRRRPSRACLRTPLRRSAACCLAVLAVVIAGTARTTSAAASDCIVLAEPLPLEAAGSSGQPAQPTPDMKRPISEADVKALIEAFEPVPLKDGQGVGIRAAVEGKSPLAADRFGVVVGDAISLLAVLHARETLDGLGKARLTADQRRTFEQDFRRVIGCGESRFASRGGAAAMKTSLEVVRKHRGELEPLLLDKLQPRRGGKEGPR